MELTAPIEDYVIKRVSDLGKIIRKMQKAGKETLVHFEVAKSTNHHKAGPVFRADCSVVVNGEQFYSSSDKEDMYEAIDDCKDQVFREIQKKKEKKFAMFKRGASKIKDMARGIRFWKK